MRILDGNDSRLLCLCGFVVFNGGNMLQKLPDEIQNDYIDSALLVDNWLHLIVEEQLKESADNNYIEELQYEMLKVYNEF